MQRVSVKYPMQGENKPIKDLGTAPITKPGLEKAMDESHPEAIRNVLDRPGIIRMPKDRPKEKY